MKFLNILWLQLYTVISAMGSDIKNFYFFNAKTKRNHHVINNTIYDETRKLVIKLLMKLCAVNIKILKLQHVVKAVGCY